MLTRMSGTENGKEKGKTMLILIINSVSSMNALTSHHRSN